MTVIHDEHVLLLPKILNEITGHNAYEIVFHKFTISVLQHDSATYATTSVI